MDYRLRGSPQIKLNIIKMLEDLRELLLEASSAFVEDAGASDAIIPESPSDSDSEPETRLGLGSVSVTHIEYNTLDIQQAIDCLYRASMDIQRQKTVNRYDKCSDIDISFFEPFDINYTRQKFPTAKEFLLQRLGKAISKRRQWLKYREQHALKLGQFLDPAENLLDSASILSETTATTFEIPTTAIEHGNSFESDLTSGGSHNLGSEPIVSDLATTFNMASLRRAQSMSTIATETTYATTLGDEGRLRMPDMPEEGLDTRPFECPYCHHIVSIQSTHAWMRHVYRDLQPYVCTFEGCSIGEETYESRHRWFNHEMQSHYRVWPCLGHCNEVFQIQEELEQHVRAHIERNIPSSQLKVFVDMAARYPDKLRTEFECPLCASRIAGAASLEKHLGRHLEGLALFALPHPESASNEASESGDSDDPEESAVPGEQLDVDIAIASTDIFGVDIEAQALAQGQTLPILVDSALKYLNSRLSPTLVNYWIKDIPTNKMNELCDSLSTRPGSPEKVFESWTSEDAVVSLVKVYLCKLPTPLLNPPFVYKFYSFQGFEHRKNKRISFIKYLILNLKTSAYHTLQAIIGHLTALLAKNAKQKIQELVEPLALCLTGSGELQSMLLVHLILRHASSIFASRRQPSQVANVMSYDDWHHFYSLPDKDIQSMSGEDVETQILLHEIVRTVRRTIERLHASKIFHKSPALHALAGSHEDRLNLQKLFKIADQMKDSYTILSKQLQIRQEEEGPWISGFSDIFNAWVWVFKSMDLHHKYTVQLNTTMNALKIADINSIAIANNPPPGEDSKLGPLFECLMSPLSNIRRCRLLLLAVFDNTWEKARARLHQRYKRTAEQFEHEHLLLSIECLDGCAHYAGLWINLGKEDMIVEHKNNVPITDQLKLSSPDRKVIYEGSVYMSTTHNKFKTIQAVEAILCDDYFILAHRRWEKRKTGSANFNVTYVIKDKKPLPFDDQFQVNVDYNLMTNLIYWGEHVVATNNPDNRGKLFPFEVFHPQVGTILLYSVTANARNLWCHMLGQTYKTYTPWVYPFLYS
ncbi:MAG: hypothetical protein Q9195_006057 [Heterodermia aff. obscurata]